MPTHLTTALAPRAPGRRRAEPSLKAKPRGFRFTDAFIKKITGRLDEYLNGRREVIQFEAATGLGVRVSQTGQISFIVQLKLKDGSRHRETLGGYGKLTIESARAAAQALAGKIAIGIDPRAEAREKADKEAADARAKAEQDAIDRLTLRVMIDQWRRKHLNGKRPSYAIRAFRNVERTFASLLDTPAASITRPQVRAILSGEELAPAAARNAAVSLKAAYQWALEGCDLLAQNPLNGLKLPGQMSERDRTLSIGEARLIYAAAGKLDYPAKHFVRLLMLTGARRGEIAGLRWDEIVTAEDGARAIVLPGNRTKTGSSHFIPLSGEALKVIGECVRVVGCKYILSSDGHQPFANFTRAKAWLDEELGGDEGAQLPHWTFHDFRRTLVSTLAGKPFRFSPIMLDLLLGHSPSQLSAIAKIYQREAHLDDRRDAIEQWARHLLQQPAAVTKMPKRQARDKS